MPRKRKIFTAKGERAIKEIRASAKKYGKEVNPYAIATARVAGSRLKKKK